MPDEFDIPDIPDVDGGDGGAARAAGNGGGGSGGRRRWPWLVAGLVVGVAVTLLGPDAVRPYLPDSLRSERLRIGGEVLKKRIEDDRLLLTVETDSGAMLATFRRRISAIDLLVEPGDSVTLTLDRYRPFVGDPGLQGVRKGRSGAPGGEPPGPTAGEGEPAAADADTVGAGTTGDEEPRSGGSAADTGVAGDGAPADGGQGEHLH